MLERDEAPRCGRAHGFYLRADLQQKGSFLTPGARGQRHDVPGTDGTAAHLRLPPSDWIRLVLWVAPASGAALYWFTLLTSKGKQFQPSTPTKDPLIGGQLQFTLDTQKLTREPIYYIKCNKHT